MGGTLIEPDGFLLFKRWLGDPEIIDSVVGLADVLTRVFDDPCWAAVPDSDARMESFRLAMSRRLWGTDEDYLVATFTELTAGKTEDDRAAAADLAGWLGQMMERYRWQRYSVTDFDSERGRWYRYDYAENAYEWRDPDTGDWRRESDQLEPGAEGAGRAGSATFSAAVFDGATRLWYRYDRDSGVYQWADGAPDAPPGPQAEWMSQAELRKRERYLLPETHPETGQRYRFDTVDQVYQWEDPRSPGTWLDEAEFSAVTAFEDRHASSARPALEAAKATEPTAGEESAKPALVSAEAAVNAEAKVDSVVRNAFTEVMDLLERDEQLDLAEFIDDTGLSRSEFGDELFSEIAAEIEHRFQDAVRVTQVEPDPKAG